MTIKTYVVKSVEKWNTDSQTFTKEPIPAGGTLYFKIEDSYYRDNVGAYKIVNAKISPSIILFS